MEEHVDVDRLGHVRAEARAQLLGTILRRGRPRNHQASSATLPVVIAGGKPPESAPAPTAAASNATETPAGISPPLQEAMGDTRTTAPIPGR